MANNIISTKNVWPNYAKGNTSPAQSSDGTLGKDQFLKILITQLQNQDPTQPLQDKEFIAQMAQFSSVEQLTSMNNEMKLLRQSLGIAPGLIGKEISWIGKDATGNETTKTGLVDALTFKDGVQYAKVGDEQISISDLLKISNPEVTP